MSYKLPFPVDDLEHSEVEIDITLSDSKMVGIGYLSASADENGVGRISAVLSEEASPDITQTRILKLSQGRAKKIQCIQERQGTDIKPRFRLVD